MCFAFKNLKSSYHLLFGCTYIWKVWCLFPKHIPTAMDHARVSKRAPECWQGQRIEKENRQICRTIPSCILSILEIGNKGTKFFKQAANICFNVGVLRIKRLDFGVMCGFCLWWKSLADFIDSLWLRDDLNLPCVHVLLLLGAVITKTSSYL